MSTSPDRLGDAIQRELTLWEQRITDNVKETAKSYMDQLVEKTKATAPVGKRKKHYYKSIKSKKTRETYRSVEYTWYVKGQDYRLTHLLEDGHALKNGGRIEGKHFIRNATEPLLEQYQNALEEIVRNG